MSSSGLPHQLRQALTNAVYRTSHHHLFRTLATEIKEDASFKRKRAATIAKLVEAKTIQDGWDGVMQNAMRDHLMKACKATGVISISRKFVSPIALGSVFVLVKASRYTSRLDPFNYTTWLLVGGRWSLVVVVAVVWCWLLVVGCW